MTEEQFRRRLAAIERRYRDKANLPNNLHLVSSELGGLALMARVEHAIASGDSEKIHVLSGEIKALYRGAREHAKVSSTSEGKQLGQKSAEYFRDLNSKLLAAKLRRNGTIKAPAFPRRKAGPVLRVRRR